MKIVSLDRHIRNYQNSFHLYNKPNVFLSEDVNSQFKYQLGLVRLVDIYQHRSNPKLKELDIFFI